MLEGWICPACGKCNSPFVAQCSCLGYQKTITTNATTTFSVEEAVEAMKRIGKIDGRRNSLRDGKDSEFD